MKCTKCGAEIADGSKVCPECGAVINQANATSVERAPKSVGGFVLSLLGLLLDWVPVLGLILSIIGVALCGSGSKTVAATPQHYTGAGLLKAGKVIGILGIIFSSIVLVIAVVWGLILGNGFFFLSDF